MYVDQLEKKHEKSDADNDPSDILSVTSESSASSCEETDSRCDEALFSEHGHSPQNDSPTRESSSPLVDAEATSVDEEEASLAEIEGNIELDYRDLLVRQLQLRDHEFVILAEYVSILKQLGSKVLLFSPFHLFTLDS